MNVPTVQVASLQVHRYPSLNSHRISIVSNGLEDMVNATV